MLSKAQMTKLSKIKVKVTEADREKWKNRFRMTIFVQFCSFFVLLVPIGEN